MFKVDTHFLIALVSGAVFRVGLLYWVIFDRF